LEEYGYSVVHLFDDVKVEYYKKMFFDFWNANPEFQRYHKVVHQHGIDKRIASHSRFSWSLRCDDQIQYIFKKLYKTDELVCSFDSLIYLQPGNDYKTGYCTHTNQHVLYDGWQCYQSQINFFKNDTTCLCVYKNSHKYHKELKNKCPTGVNLKENFVYIPPAFLAKLVRDGRIEKVVVQVEPGDFVIWDSRTFHQGEYGNNEERLVMNIAYLPIVHPNQKSYDEKMAMKKWNYYKTNRQTSHLPYPVHVNPLQEGTFGNDKLKVDYKLINRDDLTDMEDQIKKLIIPDSLNINLE
jgi:hypothetical protein